MDLDTTPARGSRDSSPRSASPRSSAWLQSPVIHWDDPASLRAELARIDARRLVIVNALAKLEDGGEIVIDDSSSESGASSVFDLTQETAPPPDAAARAPVPPPADDGDDDEADGDASDAGSDDASTVDLTKATPGASRRRARDEGATPQRGDDDGAMVDDGDDDGSGPAASPAEVRAAVARLVKSRRDLYEPILLRQKVDVNELTRVCLEQGIDCDARAVKAYLDDEGVPNVRRRATSKRAKPDDAAT